MDCNDALSYIRSKEYHPYSRCGFRGRSEIVCCPSTVQDNFGAEERIADRECQKIIATTLPPLGSHIIGGENTSRGEFPHMVILGYNVSGEYQFRCGGSLISHSYVLTAAHCLDSLDGINPTIARMGVVLLGDGSFNSRSDVRIVELIKHPNHTRRFKYNDIALIKLEKPVKFSSNVSPICLYTKDDDPSISLSITGWGRVSVSKNIRNPLLQKATVTAVSKSECEKVHPVSRRVPNGITSEQICAGDPLGLRDTCQGDSGGPLQGLTTDDGFFRLVGVTSYGRGCGTPLPAVYTRVSRYLDWIESVVWPNLV
ncbi:jg1680 [Pararge aegeria aegeria]|uniref:trypsin n=1 Tax=Pararge aegeria aegeria TaxID=348720 RepID=A0A8S4REH1_9NEOP|nr:jg1680 [Pararge aegeria aegeria]